MPSETAADSETAVNGMRARGVVTFGHEVGRVLSDGRIVGRSEPFAKVFASSREVKRAVGATAWVILEDIGLDAVIDDRGRLVADTSVRQIAANLGLNKNTVARHLARLREHGFVVHEETRDRTSGRWDTARYVLDPSACVERFTHTPPAIPLAGTVNGHADGAVSAIAEHGATGHRNGDAVYRHRDATPPRQHAEPTGDFDELSRRLRDAGVVAGVAEDLVGRYPAEQVADALDVLPNRTVTNAAGWLVRAISEAWDLHAEADAIRDARERRQREQTRADADAQRQVEREQRLAGWAAAISDALSREQLAKAVQLVTRPVGGLDRRSAPVAASQLIAWAIHTAAQAPDQPLSSVLDQALRTRTSPTPALPDDIPTPPQVPTPIAPDVFRNRVKRAVDALERTDSIHQLEQEGICHDR